MNFKDRMQNTNLNGVVDHFKRNANKYAAGASILGGALSGMGYANATDVAEDYQADADNRMDTLLNDEIPRAAADKIFSGSSAREYVDALAARDNAGWWDRHFNIDDLDRNVHSLRAQHPNFGLHPDNYKELPLQKDVLDKAVDYADGIGTDISTSLQDGFKSTQNFVNAAGDSIHSGLQSLVNKADSIGTDISTSLQDGFKSAQDAVDSMGNKITAIGDTFGKISDGFGKSMDTLYDKATGNYHPEIKTPEPIKTTEDYLNADNGMNLPLRNQLQPGDGPKTIAKTTEDYLNADNGMNSPLRNRDSNILQKPEISAESEPKLEQEPRQLTKADEYFVNLKNPYDSNHPGFVSHFDINNNDFAADQAEGQIKTSLVKQLKNEPSSLSKAQSDILTHNEKIASKLNNINSDYFNADYRANRNYGLGGALAGGGLYAAAKKFASKKNQNSNQRV